MRDDWDIDWKKIVWKHQYDKQKQPSGGPVPSKSTPRPAARPASRPARTLSQIIDFSTECSYEIDEDSWETLHGSTMHSRMFMNRVQLNANSNSTIIRGLDLEVKQLVPKWLREHCTNFWFFETNPSLSRIGYTVYFLSKADSMNFVLYWNGLSEDVGQQ